ncbi:hypothetical protein SUGI_0314870 [Cryptomeria japonica]|nr:hypothetical protein SUGI_0314870 [Cryptomeria japonica]
MEAVTKVVIPRKVLENSHKEALEAIHSETKEFPVLGKSSTPQAMDKWQILNSGEVKIVYSKLSRQGIKWKAPRKDFVKLNIDRANKGNLSEVRFGAIIQDDSSNLVSFVQGFMGTATNNEDEMKTYKRGLELCQEKGLSKIDVDGDCQIVVNTILKTNISN